MPNFEEYTGTPGKPATIIYAVGLVPAWHSLGIEVYFGTR